MFNPDMLIKDPEIICCVKEGDYSNAAKKLIEIQKESWNILKAGYDSLVSIKTKTIQFEGFSFIIQFNPGRIISSSASTDEKSIKERKCFLCNVNRPVEQKGILIDNYLLLVNPFPVFPEHFTIPYLDHIDQRIKNNFADLLYFSKILSGYYSVFYNGPQCGASAPDHLHFQAGNKSALPIIGEYDILKKEYGEILVENKDIVIYGVDDGLRKFICLESSSKDRVGDVFESFYNIYASQSDNVEPMMNIISWYRKETGWRIAVILRAKHRPEEFFKKGEGRIIFSPAASDYGGLCITPLENDFKRLNRELLVKIFNEVSINRESFNEIKKELKTKLS
jgi:hypothetical protein